MAKRRAARQTVTLYDAGTWTQLTSPGFGRRDAVAERWRAGYVYSAHISPAAYGLKGYGDKPRPVVWPVQGCECEGVIAYPFLWATEAAKQRATWYSKSSNSSFTEFAGAEYGERIFFQEDGSVDQVTSAESLFDLPPNPVFCVALWRGEAPSEQDHATNPPATYISFGNRDGNKQYLVCIPYGSDGVCLMEWNVAASEWQEVEAEGKRKLPSFEGLSEGTRKFIWVGVFDNYIHLSYDGFGSDTVAYRILDADADSEGNPSEGLPSLSASASNIR